MVGFDVAYKVSRVSDDPLKRAFADILKKGIDGGTTGLGVGEGPYSYDAEGNTLGPIEEWNLKNGQG